jgi:hypothetical protein
MISQGLREAATTMNSPAPRLRARPSWRTKVPLSGRSCTSFAHTVGAFPYLLAETGHNSFPVDVDLFATNWQIYTSAIPYPLL